MERGTFSEIDHTADLGLEIEGPDPPAVLEAAQRGLIRLLLGDVDDLTPDRERTIELSAPDWPTLLKTWCEHLYELLERDGFIALETRVETVTPGSLRAVLRGVCPGRERIAGASELKAVTWHELAFGPRETGGGPEWRARVIFDV